MLNPFDPMTDKQSRRRPVFDLTMAALRLLAKLVVAVVFAYFVGCAIWAYYNGFAIAVILGSIGLVVVAAMFLGKDAKERTLIIGTVVGAIVGGWCGYSLYFQMFRLQWFESIFNGKDLGPLGLIVFVMLGVFLAGGLCQFYLRRLFKFRQSSKTSRDSR